MSVSELLSSIYAWAEDQAVGLFVALLGVIIAGVCAAGAARARSPQGGRGLANLTIGLALFAVLLEVLALGVSRMLPDPNLFGAHVLLLAGPPVLALIALVGAQRLFLPAEVPLLRAVLGLFSADEVPAGAVPSGLPPAALRVGTVVGGLLVVGALVWTVQRGELFHPAAGPLPVAVADVANSTGEEDLDGLSGLLITSLEQSPRLDVMSRTLMFDASKQLGVKNRDRIDEALALEIARASGIKALVVATVRRFDDLYSLELKVLDPSTHKSIFAAKEQGPGKRSIPRMIDRLAERTLAGLRRRPTEAAKPKSVASMASHSMDAYHEYFEGQNLVRHSKFKEGLARLNKAVELDPEFAQALYAIAYAHYWEQRHDEAKAAIARALPLMERLSEKDQQLVRALSALMNKQWEEALGIYQTLLLSSPKDKDVLFLIGDVLYHRDDVGPSRVESKERAKDFFARALEIDPEYVLALDHAMRVSRELNQREEVVKYAEPLALHQNSFEAYAILITNLLQMGEHARAEEMIRTGLKASPNEPTLHTSAAVMAMTLDDFDTVNAELELAEKNATHPLARFYSENVRANLAVYRGRFAEADQHAARAALQVGPEMKGQRAYLDTLRLSWLIAGGDEKEALALRTKLLAEGLDVRHLMAQGYLIKDDVEAAAAVLDPALEPKKKVSYFGFGAVAGEQLEGYRSCLGGKGDAASKTLAEQAAKPTGSFTSKILQARCHARRGKPAEAIPILQEIVSQRPRVDESFRFTIVVPRALYELGMVAEQAGDKDTAVKAFTRLTRLWSEANPAPPELVTARQRLLKLGGTSRAPRTKSQ